MELTHQSHPLEELPNFLDLLDILFYQNISYQFLLPITSQATDKYKEKQPHNCKPLQRF